MSSADDAQDALDRILKPTDRRRYERYAARKDAEDKTGLTYDQRVRLRTLRWKWARLTVSDR